ncbi:hypothetical protein COT75_02625 [Candidatus Beckwithbacteria bacterium CG10_big_fil_rev_8_21_14_0_10_34_10]|uniref:PPM-type phosphatase domain-containing protein n=1 Tax=Candidatus Beckwithbacteria bacterium CG10_big_fil_rev_8_21_14_0_10_34_10 TaxID=1974495 RepID=A0A2H0W9D4_9BACT|nr:MAG: hypothetical protein COT75_02625 [Candidatus Beckwithbacteria bacterium CG10_big_fil_rev_8_21_14_0_10_34_10]
MKKFELEVGKIVGTGSKDCWSQTHVFLPKDEEKQAQYGNLLVCFSLQNKKEGLDMASFGKEIISRFHEIYYSSLEKSSLNRLKISLQSLLREFSNQVSLEIIAGVIIKKDNQVASYFSLFGAGRVMILRDNKLVTLLKEALEEPQSTSGFLKDNDLLFFGSSQVFKILPSPSLKEALESLDVGKTVEALAPEIHAQSQNSQSAAIALKVAIEQEEEKEATEEIGAEEEQSASEPKSEQDKKILFSPKKQRSKVFKNVFLVFKNIPFLGKKLIQDFKHQPDIFIKDKQKKERAKKTTLSIAIILVFLLLVSIVLGSRKKINLEDFKKSEAIFEEVNFKFDQAKDLFEVNPLKARVLLNEAKEKLKSMEVDLKTKKEKEQFDSLFREIEAKLEEVAREYQVEADIFLDLSLVKEDFKASDWDFDSESLQLLDIKTGTVLGVNLLNKAAKITAGGERLVNSLQIGAAEDILFVLKDNKIVLVDSTKGEAFEEKKAKDWGEITDIIGFSGNAYLLDSLKGKIYKYTKDGRGLGGQTDFFNTKSFNLEGSVDMAIDGSVWVLFSDGTVVKFVRGVKDSFVVTGIDDDFKEPEKIHTDENLENLYILDRQNTRVILVNKETGEYDSSYIWPGIAGAYDVFASEEQGKILLLTGDRIYEIELKSK